MERVPLDQPTLKALAGETRVRIMKLLDVKPRTQTDLAGELRMSMPTVAEHLHALENAELIEREETTRKWKYYSLTQKARMLLHPNTTTIWFVLGLFLFSAAATVFSAIKFFTPAAGFGSLAMEAKMAAQPEMLAAPAMAESAPALATTAAVPATSSPLGLLVFGAATLVLLIILIAQLKKHGWLGKSLTNKKNI